MSSKLKRESKESDGEDNDVEDQKAPDAKKAKQEDNMWELGKKRKVNVRKYQKMILIDIREYYEKDGQTLPGKKGISLSPEQFDELVKHSAEIQAAAKKL